MGLFVLLRLRAHRLPAAAALLTVLLAGTVLGALAGVTSAVGDAAVREALQSTDAAATPLLLQRNVEHEGLPAADAQVRTIAAQAFPGLPTSVAALAESDPYGLPGPATGGNTDITVLATPDRSKLLLASGSWPGPAEPGSPIPVAVPLAAAARFGAEPGRTAATGDVHSLADRLTGKTLPIRITGVYTIRDPADRYWQLDPLGGKGTSSATPDSSFTSYGPLLVDTAALSTGAVPQRQVFWQVTADFRAMTAARLGPVAAAQSAVVHRLNTAASSSGQNVSATSDLPTLLTQLQQTVLLARSALLVTMLQLALLAVTTLLLVARLLAAQHRSGDALLRARGAAPGRIAALAVVETALLALPAAVLAPLLAGPLVRLLGEYGPLAASGVRLDGPVPAAAGWAAGAAVVGALVLFAPVLARLRTGPAQPGGRQSALSGILRGGADAALVALAVAAYWQLSHSGSSGALSPDSSGVLGIDPVLVAAPALALCAGTVLTLRLLPPAAHLAERLTARLRGLPGALAGWEVSRRPQQAAGPVLVLALASAIGTLAVGQGASWERSQRDQAAFDTGGDVRVAGSDTPGFGQGGLYAALPGVTRAVPVARTSLPLGADRIGELLALDTRAEGGSYPLRSDLADRDAARLLGPLADLPETDAQRGIPLPGRRRPR
ncbi:hypothetical protein [Peterkaempfera sp. SMS 1(5)a]|uniref:hypothetical protein n=1 Tax=Peterkaempfera podocarpi TaxID=3232308 RepID=UPI003670660E